MFTGSTTICSKVNCWEIEKKEKKVRDVGSFASGDDALKISFVEKVDA